MRKTNYIFRMALAVVASSWMFTSCDKIDEPYVIKKEIVDTAQCPVPDFPAVNNPEKRVLLEDYTGHTCVNCPRAAVTAHDLKQQYGEQLVVMAVHAGFFAKPLSAPFDYDFRTAAGTTWDDLFGIGKVGNPNGMVNRTGYPSQHILSPSAWGNAIATAVTASPLAELQILSDFDDETSKLCVHTKTTFLQNISNREIKLSVVIVEDSIVQAQKNNDAQVGTTPQIDDYVHMHVLRGAINSPWGEIILAKGAASGDPLIKSYQIKLEGLNKYEMDPANCRVVAFLYDGETYEVLQVSEAGIAEE